MFTSEQLKIQRLKCFLTTNTKFTLVQGQFEGVAPWHVQSLLTRYSKWCNQASSIKTWRDDVRLPFLTHHFLNFFISLSRVLLLYDVINDSCLFGICRQPNKVFAVLSTRFRTLSYNVSTESSEPYLDETCTTGIWNTCVVNLNRLKLINNLSYIPINECKYFMSLITHILGAVTLMYPLVCVLTGHLFTNWKLQTS